MSMTNVMENFLVDHIFRAATWAKPANLYIALYTAAPSDAGGGTEVSGGSYARAQLNPSDTNWVGTHGTTTGASSGTGGMTKNAAAITFPAPTADWGTVTHWALFTVSVSGDAWVWGALANSRQILNNDDPPSFPINALQVTFD